MLVTSPDWKSRRETSTGERRQARGYEPRRPAAVKRLVKVSCLIELAADVTLLDFVSNVPRALRE